MRVRHGASECSLSRLAKRLLGCAFPNQRLFCSQASPRLGGNAADRQASLNDPIAIDLYRHGRRGQRELVTRAVPHFEIVGATRDWDCGKHDVGNQLAPIKNGLVMRGVPREQVKVIECNGAGRPICLHGAYLGIEQIRFADRLTVCMDVPDGLRDITLVGQDWGGLIGLRIAAENPDRFARVVAANTALPTGDQEMPPIWHAFRNMVNTADVLSISRIVQAGTLPADLDVGYRILIDKDGLTGGLQPPTYTAYIPSPPAEQDYQKMIEDFFSDAPYVAKCLWRDELLPAKWCLDYDMKHNFLRLMLEWRMELDHGWSAPTGALGKGLKKRLPSEIWSQLESTYAGAEIADNWEALFRTMALFRQAATEVGKQLGYAYPLEMDERVTNYVKQMQER